MDIRKGHGDEDVLKARFGRLELLSEVWMEKQTDTGQFGSHRSSLWFDRQTLRVKNRSILLQMGGRGRSACGSFGRGFHEIGARWAGESQAWQRSLSFRNPH